MSREDDLDLDTYADLTKFMDDHDSMFLSDDQIIALRNLIKKHRRIHHDMEFDYDGQIERRLLSYVQQAMLLT